MSEWVKVREEAGNEITKRRQEMMRDNLDDRRETYRNHDWARFSNKLRAGSDCYYGCLGCNAPINMPETWITRPDLCRECRDLKAEGLL